MCYLGSYMISGKFQTWLGGCWSDDKKEGYENSTRNATRWNFDQWISQEDYHRAQLTKIPTNMSCN